MGISVGCDNLKYAIVDGEQGDVEGTTTEVKHKDVLLPFFLVQTIGNGCCGPGVEEETAINETSTRKTLMVSR